MSKQKDSALNLAKFVDKSIRVKLAGGRESGYCASDVDHIAAGGPSVLTRAVPLPAVVGVLKGYDQLLNLVLDEAVEYLRGAPQSCNLSPLSPPHLPSLPWWLNYGVLAHSGCRSRGPSAPDRRHPVTGSHRLSWHLGHASVTHRRHRRNSKPVWRLNNPPQP